MHRLVGVLAVGLQERHPSPGLGRQPLEPLSRSVQHRRRRVEQGHVVAGLGQRERLVAGAAADVEHRRWRRRQMLAQLLVQHMGAHVPLHRGIGLVGELFRQLGPGVIAHHTKIAGQHVRRGRGSLPWRPLVPGEWSATVPDERPVAPILVAAEGTVAGLSQRLPEGGARQPRPAPCWPWAARRRRIAVIGRAAEAATRVRPELRGQEPLEVKAVGTTTDVGGRFGVAFVPRDAQVGAWSRGSADWSGMP
jgi:hypothetical protein